MEGSERRINTRVFILPLLMPMPVPVPVPMPMPVSVHLLILFDFIGFWFDSDSSLKVNRWAMAKLTTKTIDSINELH